MIYCDTCKKGFSYTYLLLKHLERKTPCKLTAPVIKNRETTSLKHGKCQYCHKHISRPGRLRSHEQVCKLKDDKVRRLEIQLNKNVCLDPDSKKCRFCDTTLYNVNSLRRHDKICKYKDQYMMNLAEECRPMSVNITVNNTTINNTIDWNDLRGMRELLEQLLTPEQIQNMTRTGDVAISLGNIARVYYSHTDSVVCTNLRSNIMRCRENGTVVSHNADYVSSCNIEPMIHRVQDTDDMGHKIPNIDEYHMLDRLTRVSHMSLSKEQKIFLKNVMDEQKNATYDAFRNRLT